MASPKPKKSEPIPIDGSRQCAERLADRYPEHGARIRPASADEQEHAYRVRELDEDMAAKLGERRFLENWFRERIGDDRGIEGPDWKITWARPRPSVGVDFQAAFRLLSERLKASPQMVARVLEESKFTRPAARRFLVHFGEPVYTEADEEGDL